MLVEAGFVTWVKARHLVLTGTIVWTLTFGWPRLPAQIWPVVSFAWLVELCLWRPRARAADTDD